MASSRKKHYLRYFFAIIGTLVLFWKVVTGFHDMKISYEGSRCVGEFLGSGFYEHWEQDSKWKKKNRWNEAAISYIKKSVAPNKQAQTIDDLRQHCSKYIEVWQTFEQNMNGGPSIREDIIVVKNWGRSGYSLFMKELNPAISDKRFKSMFFWAAFVLFFIVDIRRINKIFIWYRDDK